MAHDTTHENLSPEEQKYRDTVSRGDDYHRIELYRWGLHYYNLAKAMNIHDDTLQGKIDTITEKIRKETRTIIIVLVVAAIIVGAYFLFT